MRDLKEIRKTINETDAKMRELFAERMAAAREVAEYKAAHGLPILDAARESEVIERNAAELSDDELRPYYVNFLQGTMAASRSYQDMLISGMRVAYSGALGAFAYIAACKLFPNARKIAYPNFESAYNAAASGECDAVVLPIENSVGGEVGAVTDLMFAGPLTVNGIIDIDIAHCLLGIPGQRPRTSRALSAILRHSRSASPTSASTALLRRSLKTRHSRHSTLQASVIRARLP